MFLLCAFFGHQNVFAQPLFEVNGAAVKTSDNCYTLTPAINNQAGSIWCVNQIDLTYSFETEMLLYFGCADTTNCFEDLDSGADGIVFAFQPVSTSIGSSGGSLGIEGVEPSLCIEFDTYPNGQYGDLIDDHIAVYSDGDIDHNSIKSLVAPVTATDPPTNIENCSEHTIKVVWSAETQNLKVYFDCQLRVDYTGINIIDDIFGGDPNVYWGFTASTGGCNNEQRVCVVTEPSITTTNHAICAGGSVQIEAIGFGLSYEWSPTDGLSDPNIANPIATPTKTTQYVVLITGPDGCTTPELVIVTVNDELVVDAGLDITTCPGQAVQLLVTPGGATKYEWSDPTITQNAFPQVAPLTTTTYIVTVTDANGCVGSDEITVFVVDDLQVSAGDDVSICPDETVQLHVSPADAATYAWSDASIEQSANPSVSPSQTTTYTVTVTDANGCFGSASVTVEVIPVSDPGTMPDAQFVCDGASLSIASVNPVIAEGQGLTYVMHTASGNSLGTVLAINPDGNFDITSAPGLQVNTIYYISAVAGPLNTNGNVDFGSPCTRVAPGTPVVFLLPIKLTVKDYCDNVSTLFTLQVSVSGGLPAYDPANEVYNITGEYMGALQYNENVTLGPFDNAITYVLTATDAAGCLGVDSRFVECLKGPAGIELAAFYAQIQPNSTELIWQTATQTNSQYFVIESSTDGFTYTEVCTEPAAGNSNIIQDYQCSHLNPASGLTYYRLTEIDANNQKTIQGVISVMRSKAIQNSLAISQVSTDANQQNLTLYLQKPNTNTLANIQILSTQGQVVQTGQTHHAVWQTDIAHLPSGLYLLIAQVNDEMISKKIVINR